MNSIFLSPPLAFLIYLVLVLILSGFGRILAGPTTTSEYKSSLYASGEESPKVPAAPGYRPFFIISLFFAILHLGALMLGTGGLTPLSAVYLVGLVLALLALVLG
jgi:NADH:ubiquinone oxidoreductase subunit 3 (subunit A)